MHDTTNSTEAVNEKHHAFSVIKNVRDMCKQPVTKKLLMITLATYCDRDGICWPGNRALASATGVSKRTIQRMLLALETVGELEILTPGIGRDQKRFIQLRRYSKGVTVMSCLNAPCLPMKSVLEQSVGTAITHSSSKNGTHPAIAWRRYFSEKELRIIDLYNTLCVPRGWRLVNRDSLELHKALAVLVDAFDPSEDEKMFLEAAEERDVGIRYCAPLGNKLLRILRRHFPSNAA